MGICEVFGDMNSTIFVVDDNDTNLLMVKEALEDQYRVITLPSAEKMFAVMEKIKPDLILLDIEMPGMDGFEALRRLKTSLFASIPVIFLTSMNDSALEVRGFTLGAVDFITKPFTAPILLNRIKTHLHVDEIIRERTEEIRQLKNAIVISFADIVEKRDHETGGHVDRTAKYIEILIDAMMKSGVYEEELRNMNFDSFISSARLHDVGKIAIPDSILNKPSRLNEEETENMKTHAIEGEEIINQIAQRANDDEFLSNARLFAGFHHERWDGMGYPYGLEETRIPLQGRIMAIVDVYDALVSERPYKKAFTEEEAISIIMKNAGTQFDPFIADVFFQVKDQFGAVKQNSTKMAAKEMAP